MRGCHLGPDHLPGDAEGGSDLTMRACERWTLGMTAIAVLIAGCMTVTPPPPSGPPPPPPAASAPPAAAPIDCNTDGRGLHADTGQLLQVTCPAGCEGAGEIAGTGVYTSGSPVCRAAIHAGAIGPGGGVVSLRIDPERAAFRGSERHGLRSGDAGGEPFAVAVLVPGAPPPPVLPRGGLAEAGCTFSARSLRAESGRAYLVACPPGCAALEEGIFGTDTYGFDSSICRAALHAGVVTDKEGGTAKVVVGDGQTSYRGTTRNGIRSHDGGRDMGSFTVARP